MEVVTGALPSVIAKLGELLVGEYNLHKELKGGIRFLQAELESIKGVLEDISTVPADQLPNQEKIWARNVRELSYDIEDRIDTFMVQRKGRKLAKQHGLKRVIDASLDWLMQPKIRHEIATEIGEIKRRVVEVHERRRRYEFYPGVYRPVRVTEDPRLSTQYMDVKELVGMDEAMNELVQILTGENEVSMQQGKVVSIVGFGGLGKTTLAMQFMKRLEHDSIVVLLYQCLKLLTSRNYSRACYMILARTSMKKHQMRGGSSKYLENSFKIRVSPIKLEVEQAKVTLRRAAEIHPNHPHLTVLESN